VTDSVNIVGSGQSATIIQGGTSLATSVDKVFSFNQDVNSFTNATVNVSNLTIQNGLNRGNDNLFSMAGRGSAGPTPEPAAWVLTGSALLMFAGWRAVRSRSMRAAR